MRPPGRAADDIVVSGRRPPPRHVPRETVTGVYNVVGFADADGNEGGALSIDDDGVRLANGRGGHAIPLGAIRSFAIEHGNRGLLRGTKGMIASFAPQGIGQVYSLFRPGAEVLTLFYADEDRGLHGAVLMLPVSRAEAAARALTAAGIAPFKRTPSGRTEQPSDTRISPTRWTSPNVGGDLRVLVPTAAVDDIPVAYIAATYEALVAQLDRKTTSYRIFRQDDLRADPQALALSTTVLSFRKGSAGLRGAVPIVGALAGKTSIAADARVTDPAGRTLLVVRSQGARMLPGESLGAATGLAKQIGGKLEKATVRGGDGDMVASR
jgi:hypothetical protein